MTLSYKKIINRLYYADPVQWIATSNCDCVTCIDSNLPSQSSRCEKKKEEKK